MENHDQVNPNVSQLLDIEKKYEGNLKSAIVDMKKFVVEYMKDFQTQLQKKYENENIELNFKLAEAEKALTIHKVKIDSIQNDSQVNQNKIDKINDLIINSKKSTDQITSIEIKLNALQKDYSSSCYKYDKIYLENLHIPGTLGEFCKYKNLREYVEVNTTII